MATLDVNPQRYQAQLAEKVQRLTDMFAPYQAPELEVFESPEQHYRMRAEFRVWHEGDEMYYIMFNQETREKYRVDQFPAAS
ncbi:tRNA (uridine(54)-C5)-methyltransferase TrmA, partial [Vibrio parahaemolyticus]|nr:tRNA (uridine(54)-C5)-methyltransferase TrmA [Vibrio parahaemolyticus]